MRMRETVDSGHRTAMAMGTNTPTSIATCRNACTDVDPHSALAIAWWVPWVRSDAGDEEWYRRYDGIVHWSGWRKNDGRAGFETRSRE